MHNWSLPPHFSDILPNKAWHIELLRNQWLQIARSYGYELVIPPMFEFAETLLAMHSASLEMKSFRVADPITGKQLAIRADITNQIARLDGHIFRKEGITRLCYCGPVVSTYPEDEWGQREQLQFGAELLGHNHLEAEAEIIHLAINGLASCGLNDIVLQISHTGVLSSILKSLALSEDEYQQLCGFLAHKDLDAIKTLVKNGPNKYNQILEYLVQSYGSIEILDQILPLLAEWPDARQAILQLQHLISQLPATLKNTHIQIDFTDHIGFNYYSGIDFVVYVRQLRRPLLRGGRYYTKFSNAKGEFRSAVGFSFDVKNLVALVQELPQPQPIQVLWSDLVKFPNLHAVVHELRHNGQIVSALAELVATQPFEQLVFDEEKGYKIVTHQ